MDIGHLRRKAQLLTPNEVCAELLALSVVEHSYTPGTVITIELRESGGVICDTGRGMRLRPDPGDSLSHAERALTSVYPCLPASSEVESILCELIWGPRGSQGPALANHACPEFEFVSAREREVWSQRYRYGRPAGPATRLGRTDRTGTTIRFETAAPIDVTEVRELAGSLTSRIPGLVITGSRSPSVEREDPVLGGAGPMWGPRMH